MSDKHFSVDGTLIEVAANLNNFRSEEGPTSTDDDPSNLSVDFRSECRSAMRGSRTEAEERMPRKGWGQEARLTFMGPAPVENCRNLPMDFAVGLASDQSYSTKDCMNDMRAQIAP